MVKQLQPIGSREIVLFPELGMLEVPAKVDTGADYSSIWASNIIEAEGELSFTLFAPGSRYYTGERIRTNDYSLTYVRSSFGHSQERYKVKLLVRIRSKRVRVELTLADRSNNRYPMLIGKKTLHDRFLVDVSRDGVASRGEPLRVLIMNSKKSPKIRSFFDKMTADNKGLECHFATYDDVRFDIFDEMPVCSVLTYGTKLSDYDLIYFKTYFRHAEVAAAMTEVAIADGVEFIDKEVASYHAKTKLTQYVRLARHGVSVPESIVIPTKHLSESYDDIYARLGELFIMKDVAGERGESNYLVKSRKEYDEICRAGLEHNLLYVCQRYIENDGDYRAIVLNKKVELVIERKAVDDSTHLTNVSKGGTARQLSVSEFGSEPTAIAIRAAAVMNRQVAGIDLVFDTTQKKWLVFEVNNSPQLANGSYIEEKQVIMSRFLRAYAKK